MTSISPARLSVLSLLACDCFQMWRWETALRLSVLLEGHQSGRHHRFLQSAVGVWSLTRFS